jgi:hypothetical protein
MMLNIDVSATAFYKAQPGKFCDDPGPILCIKNCVMAEQRLCRSGHKLFSIKMDNDVQVFCVCNLVVVMWGGGEISALSTELRLTKR